MAPAANGMPPIDCSPDRFLTFMSAGSFEGDEWLTHDEHWLTANLARLTDKAIREYEAASDSLGTFVHARTESEARPPDPIIRRGNMPIPALAALLTAADRIENCVDALRRIDLFMRSKPFADSIAASGHTYPPPYVDELHEGVRLIRNRIEHAEEVLAKGKVGPGEPLFVAVGADGISFAGQSILYAELVALIVTAWMMVSAVIEAS